MLSFDDFLMMTYDRSHNVLGWFKFFVPDQKFIYILWQSQTFWARQKDDFHSVKCRTKVFEEALNAIKFWAGSKNLDRRKTFWDL
jgi:hypothetical protein